jgi:hypothetical protein
MAYLLQAAKRFVLSLHLWRTAIVAVLVLFLLIPFRPESALADSNLGQQQALAQLEQALSQTTAPGQLADLTSLKEAIAASSDRSQVSNNSSHQIGLFARYKKADPQQQAEFYVLAPGHQTDDDFEALALLVPPGVGLDWTSNRLAAEPRSARLVAILPGEQLVISDPEPSPGAQVQAPGQPTGQPVSEVNGQPRLNAADQTLTYQLNLPPFQVTRQLESVASLPALDQAELDAAPETAPLD